MQVIADSYTIVFPKSDATRLPSGSLRATKVCYFSTCITKHSISITKENGSDYLLQKDVSQVRHLLSTLYQRMALKGSTRKQPAENLLTYRFTDLQWYLFSKNLKSILFQNVFLRKTKKNLLRYSFYFYSPGKVKSY